MYSERGVLLGISEIQFPVTMFLYTQCRKTPTLSFFAKGFVALPRPQGTKKIISLIADVRSPSLDLEVQIVVWSLDFLLLAYLCKNPFLVTMFNAKVVSFLAALSLTAADVVQASGWNQQHYTSCDNFPCGPHYVCQMVEPNGHCPHASCAFPQCVPPTSCDDLDCPAGYVCEVDDPPSNCPHCQPRAVCKPENQGYCENGQAYNYQIGQCVPYTCESPDVRTLGTCISMKMISVFFFTVLPAHFCHLPTE